VFFMGYVPSASMEPTIKAESFVVGRRIIGEINRGDILVFERDGFLQVKRVAGVPGDVVTIDDSQRLTVPVGCYFMLGDNPDDSLDSRMWEDPFVERAQVIAVLFRQ